MAFGTQAAFEAVREVAFGSITGSYAAIGSATSHHARIVEIVNTTNVDIYLSLDGSTNHMRIPSGGFQLYDFTANEVMQDGLFIHSGTIFYVKQQSGSPTSGSVWVQVVYASGGV